MFLHHIDSTNQSAPTHASNDQADGYATKKKKIGISTWRHKNMRKQRCFEDIEIKNLSGISQQRNKKKLQSDTLRWMDTFWPRKRTHEQHRAARKTQKAQAWTILNWLQSGVKASWWESFEKLLLPSGFWFFYFFFIMKPSSSLLSSKVTPPSVT